MEQQNELNTESWVLHHLAARNHFQNWNPNTRRGLELLCQKRLAAQNRNNRLLWTAAGALAIVVTVLAYPPGRAYAEKCVSECVSKTERACDFVVSCFVPNKTRTSQALEERRQAPDFTAQDANGATVQLSKLQGRVVLLNFWATWCPPCREEIPWFVDFEHDLESKGLSVIGVSMDETGWKGVLPFLAKQRINYPILLGGDELAELFGGLESIPTTLVIDRKGRIAATHVGKVNRNEYESEIQAILAEQ